jgi:hypothetical protein
MVFIKGINAPLIQVTKPKMKKILAIITMGTKLFFVLDVVDVLDMEIFISMIE